MAQNIAQNTAQLPKILPKLLPQNCPIHISRNCPKNLLKIMAATTAGITMFPWMLNLKKVITYKGVQIIAQKFLKFVLQIA